MKKLLKKLHWAMKRKQIEEGVLAFCKLEYSAGEVTYAFEKVLANHKAAFIKGVQL